MPFLGNNQLERLVKNIKANLDQKQGNLSNAQMAAADSGITADKVKTYDGYASGKQDALDDAQIAAIKSGLTSADKAKLDGIEKGANKYTLPAASATTLGGVKAGNNVTIATDGTISAPAAAGNGTITVTAFDGTTTTFTTNQSAAGTVGKGMSGSQLAAINSGITSAKVSTYDGYASQIAGKATPAQVDEKIAAAQVGAAMFQGTINKAADIANGYKKGYYWVVGTAGTYVGQACEAGDMIFAVKDATSSTALTNGDFSIVQNNLQEMSQSDVDSAFRSAGLTTVEVA